VLRAIELAQTELQGKAREYATAKLLIDLIMAEYADTPRLYEQFAQQTQDRYALFAVEKQYAQFRAFMNAEPPADAQLYIIDEDYALSFEALLAKYKGKVIYIDFWASWCAPCLSELPYSQTLQKILRQARPHLSIPNTRRHRIEMARKHRPIPTKRRTLLDEQTAQR
jgi:hypothetical protein